MSLPSQKIPRSTAAFTLFEVMMAAGLLVLTIVATFQMVVAGSRMMAQARNQTIAAQIIHSEIDKLHLVDWATFSANYVVAGAQNVTINSSLANVSSNFTCTRTVTSAKADNTLYKVVFTVTWTTYTTSNWTGGGVRTYTRQGVTYYGKNGLAVTYQRS